MSINQPFRLLPSVHELVGSAQGQSLCAHFPRALVVDALRSTLDDIRASIRAGGSCPSTADILLTAEQFLQQTQRPHLHPLINATGVIINTNLGRAPLSAEALKAVREVAGGYSNLEYELDEGKRSSRHSHVRMLLQELTGAEDALVVNNNAAAVLLSLSALALGREVLISRGQLVEIGGGFRVPDVLRQSGCQLVEVGTTNRTRIADYEAALSAQTALLLSVHPSNFLISGFTESTSVHELAELASAQNLLVMDDLGSGCLLASERYGLAHEPTPQESLAAGVDLVCFSGDKLLGGPQAGLIVGKAAIIARLAKHPLLRAVRIDKMTLAALEATLRQYQRGEAEQRIPIWQMISAHPEDLASRVQQWIGVLQAKDISARSQRGSTTVGGGSLPGETLPTWLLAVDAGSLALPLEELARRLRTHTIPVVGRIQHDALLLDPRTVLPEQDDDLLQAISACVTS